MANISIRPSAIVGSRKNTYMRNPAPAIVFQSAKVMKMAFPHEMFPLNNKDNALVEKLNELNSLDEGGKVAVYKRNMCAMCPREFHRQICR